MKIRFEMEVKSCRTCPLSQNVYEHGFSGTCCIASGICYDVVPDEGVRKDCPCKIEEK